MPWIEFTQNFDWHVRRAVTISYRAGKRYLVMRRCASEAIARGKGVPCARPEKKSDERRTAPASDHL